MSNTVISLDTWRAKTETARTDLVKSSAALAKRLTQKLRGDWRPDPTDSVSVIQKRDGTLYRVSQISDGRWHCTVTLGHTMYSMPQAVFQGQGSTPEDAIEQCNDHATAMTRVAMTTIKVLSEAVTQTA